MWPPACPSGEVCLCVCVCVRARACACVCSAYAHVCVCLQDSACVCSTYAHEREDALATFQSELTALKEAHRHEVRAAWRRARFRIRRRVGMRAVRAGDCVASEDSDAHHAHGADVCRPCRGKRTRPHPAAVLTDSGNYLPAAGEYSHTRDARRRFTRQLMRRVCEHLYLSMSTTRRLSVPHLCCGCGTKCGHARRRVCAQKARVSAERAHAQRCAPNRRFVACANPAVPPQRRRRRRRHVPAGGRSTGATVAVRTVAARRSASSRCA